jgi:hypothetical protein
MLNKVILDVRIDWPAYRARNVVSREHPVYKFELQQLTPGSVDTRLS